MLIFWREFVMRGRAACPLPYGGGCPFLCGLVGLSLLHSFAPSLLHSFTPFPSPFPRSLVAPAMQAAPALCSLLSCLVGAGRLAPCLPSLLACGPEDLNPSGALRHTGSIGSTPAGPERMRATSGLWEHSEQCKTAQNRLKRGKN